MRIKKL